MCVFKGRISPSLHFGISAFNSAIIELYQLLVSAKVIQLKGAGETNLLQIELVEVLWSREGCRGKGGEGKAVGRLGEQGFISARSPPVLSWSPDSKDTYAARVRGQAFLACAIKGWLEQSSLLFGPGKWWGCKWNPAEGNKRWGDCLVQPDSRVGAPLGHVNWSHLLPIPTRSSCYYCRVGGGAAESRMGFWCHVL